jgi:hypothetical protein
MCRGFDPIKRRLKSQRLVKSPQPTMAKATFEVSKHGSMPRMACGGLERLSFANGDGLASSCQTKRQLTSLTPVNL